MLVFCLCVDVGVLSLCGLFVFVCGLCVVIFSFGLLLVGLILFHFDSTFENLVLSPAHYTCERSEPGA